MSVAQINTINDELSGVYKRYPLGTFKDARRLEGDAKILFLLDNMRQLETISNFNDVDNYEVLRCCLLETYNLTHPEQ